MRRIYFRFVLQLLYLNCSRCGVCSRYIRLVLFQKCFRFVRYSGYKRKVLDPQHRAVPIGIETTLMFLISVHSAVPITTTKCLSKLYLTTRDIHIKASWLYQCRLSPCVV